MKPFDITLLAYHNLATRDVRPAELIHDKGGDYAYPLQVMIDGKMHLYPRNGIVCSMGNDSDDDLVLVGESTFIPDEVEELELIQNLNNTTMQTLEFEVEKSTKIKVKIPVPSCYRFGTSYMLIKGEKDCLWVANPNVISNCTQITSGEVSNDMMELYIKQGERVTRDKFDEMLQDALMRLSPPTTNEAVSEKPVAYLVTPLELEIA